MNIWIQLQITISPQNLKILFRPKAHCCQIFHPQFQMARQTDRQTKQVKHLLAKSEWTQIQHGLTQH